MDVMLMSCRQASCANCSHHELGLRKACLHAERSPVAPVVPVVPVAPVVPAGVRGCQARGRAGYNGEDRQGLMSPGGCSTHCLQDVYAEGRALTGHWAGGRRMWGCFTSGTRGASRASGTGCARGACSSILSGCRRHSPARRAGCGGDERRPQRWVSGSPDAL